MDSLKPYIHVTSELARSIIDMLPTGAMVVNSEGVILVSNSILDDVFESDCSVAGSSINKYLPAAVGEHAHELYMRSFFDDPTPRQMGAGKSLHATTFSGRHIPIEIGLNPIYVNEQLCVLATVVDITSRLEASLLVERSIEAAPHGVLLVDQSGAITLANQSLCDCFGYAMDEVVGKRIEFLLPARYRDSHLTMRKSFWSKPSVRRMGVGRDLTALHADGREFPVEIGLSPLSEENQVTLVTLTDITDRKRMELELKDSNQSLEEFTYVASHDLKSPLRGISDLVEWIKDDLGSDVSSEVPKNLNRISVRVNRMELLIENLLSYARSGKSESEVEEIGIPELMDSTLSFLNVPPQFTVSLSLSEKNITAVKTPLETVLRNIISNAVKHHDKNEGTIQIFTKSEGNMVLFSITDDGPGIPKSSRQRVFKLFQTASTKSKRSTGIGLSVCRRLVEAHGGRIEFKCDSKNTTFFVWWPKYIRKDTHD